MRKVVIHVGLIGCLIAGRTTTAWSSIYGTMSNFDVFNETETEAHGAELELEGVHIEDFYRTFPSHYDHETISEYQDGAVFGTRIVYTGYNFDPAGFLAPTVGQSTNGHSCVNTAGCEHFGFSVSGAPPTTARYYWLDANGQRIGDMPMAVPTPNWSYVPPAGGGLPRLRAEIQVPEPPEVIDQKPDSIWMKVYKTELERTVDLLELMSNNGIVPEGQGEMETEWELLEGGKMDAAEDDVPDGKVAVIRRYEFFEYTGPYDEENEPTSLFLDEDLPEPPEGELGQFIASNMVAANLAAPAQPLLGDFNSSGGVEQGDLDLVLLHWGDDEDLVPAGWTSNFPDGRVNQDELDDVLLHWGDAVLNAAAVPEPATAILAMFSTVICMAIRRR